MVVFLRDYLCGRAGMSDELVSATLVADYRAAGGRTHFDFEAPGGPRPLPKPRKGAAATPARQTRHLQGDA